jgi:hypothetical protein
MDDLGSGPEAITEQISIFYIFFDILYFCCYSKHCYSKKKNNNFIAQFLKRSLLTAVRLND